LATGVVDATFGNAVEMIISFIALINKQTSLVQYALLGAMLVKALLVRLTSGTLMADSRNLFYCWCMV
jgi:calcium/proton exchanger cax